MTDSLRALLVDCRTFLDVAHLAFGYDAELRPNARRETLAEKARALKARVEGELAAITVEADVSL